MTLIDTSALIEFLRKSGNADIKTQVAGLIRSGEAAYTCPIRYELLAGAYEHERPMLSDLFEISHHIPVEIDDWIRAADIRSKSRRNGLTIPVTDLLIYCVADRMGIPVLSDDAHFGQIQDGVDRGW